MTAAVMTSLAGPATVLLRIAAVAVIVLGLAGAVREAWRWYASYDDVERASDAPSRGARSGPRDGPADFAGLPQRLQRAAEAVSDRNRSLAQLRSTPRVIVLQLADSGLALTEIARRTGLSRDAVAMAIATRR